MEICESPGEPVVPAGERGQQTALASRRHAGAVTALLLALLGSTAGSTASAGDGGPHEVQLEHREIAESSGVAASHRSAGLLWTHNDSGDTPRLFCFDVQGRHRGIAHIRDAVAVDWEDVASYTLGGRPKLLIADVGDNARRRRYVSLYEIDEPSPEAQADTRPTRRWQVRYEHGPRDCEAVAVDAASNEIILADKSLLPHCTLWSLPLDAGAAEPEPDATVVAKAIGSLAIPLVTAMDISADGQLMVLGTYADAVLIVRRRDGSGRLEPWSSALGRPPIHVALPPRQQGEAVCFADGETAALVLTSEKRPVPLIRVPLDDYADRWQSSSSLPTTASEEGL